ncbi:MAG: hypothetical protein WBP45_00300 [Daejeonella sp.]
MKKLTNSVSPFIMLLIPLFLIIGICIFNIDNQIPAEKYEASINLQVPTFKVMIQSLF